MRARVAVARSAHLMPRGRAAAGISYYIIILLRPTGSMLPIISLATKEIFHKGGAVRSMDPPNRAKLSLKVTNQ